MSTQLNPTTDQLTVALYRVSQERSEFALKSSLKKSFIPSKLDFGSLHPLVSDLVKPPSLTPVVSVTIHTFGWVEACEGWICASAEVTSAWIARPAHCSAGR